jgi:hypothetical protein
MATLRRKMTHDKRVAVDYPTYHMTVPVSIGRRLDHLVGEHFTPVLTEEGILFRFAAEVPDDDLPEWARRP